jgi:putative transposase
MWTLPKNDDNYSKRIGLIKAGFTSRVRERLQKSEWMTTSRLQHRESTIWQRRFWEHSVRDEQDFSRHVDYIHFNPVKHGLVKQVIDWPYSTFHQYVKNGVYPRDWAGLKENSLDEFGE